MFIELSQEEANRRIRQLNIALKELTLATGIFLRGLDEVMKEPSSQERGKKIGALSNKLEYARDHARYFGLGIDYRHDPEIKNHQRLNPKEKIAKERKRI